ncbi:MAG TPA: hypothetical protein VHN59_07160 [Chitinophagaceae bacterium]|nr:hypothetical protein [Chitinophagaceae bacterium]
MNLRLLLTAGLLHLQQTEASDPGSFPAIIDDMCCCADISSLDVS